MRRREEIDFTEQAAAIAARQPPAGLTSAFELYGRAYLAREIVDGVAPALALRVGEDQVTADVMSSLATSLSMLDRHDEADALMARHWPAVERLPDPLSSFFTERGLVCDNAGRPHEGREFHRRAIDIGRRRGEHSEAMVASQNLAASCIDTGELASAAVMLQQAEALRLAHDDLHSAQAMGWNLLAIVRRDQAHYGRALDASELALADAADRLPARVPLDRQHCAWTWYWLGQWTRTLQDLPKDDAYPELPAWVAARGLQLRARIAVARGSPAGDTLARASARLEPGMLRWAWAKAAAPKRRAPKAWPGSTARCSVNCRASSTPASATRCRRTARCCRVEIDGPCPSRRAANFGGFAVRTDAASIGWSRHPGWQPSHGPSLGCIGPGPAGSGPAQACWSAPPAQRPGPPLRKLKQGIQIARAPGDDSPMQAPSRPSGFRLRLCADAALLAPGGRAVLLERRAAALLALAALEPGISRLRAATMLWPDSADPRRNLRQQLLRFKQQFGRALLGGENALVLAGELHVELEGVLLANHGYEDIEAFAEWLERQRETRRAGQAEALRQQIARAEAAGELDRALHAAEQLAGVEPASEDAQRELMRIHYLRDDTAAGLAVHRRLTAQLDKEHGTVPTPATERLARALRDAAPVQRGSQRAACRPRCSARRA